MSKQGRKGADVKNFLDRAALPVFVAGCVALVWLAGAMFARFGIFPYPAIDSAIGQVRSAAVATDKYHPALHNLSGARTSLPDRIAPGVTLVTTYFADNGWKTGLRLIDRDGTVLHDWRFDLADILPDHKPYQDYVHGSYLFENGDVLFNVEFAGLVRLDRCGKLIWRNADIRGHHSVSRAADGNFWVSGNRIWPDTPEGQAHLEKYKILRPPIYEDLLVKISPDGEVLKTISMIDVIYENGLTRMMTKMGRGKVFNSGDRKGLSDDIFHLNDVEELSPAMAADYPLFQAGDLVVSLRQLHAVIVLDPDDGKVKWLTYTSTTMQHDPDFIGGGWIGIFDNNPDFTARGTLNGGSRILAVRPETGEEKVLFAGREPGSVFSEFGGKWQALANGNLLLTVAREGRALEVTSDGQTVWEWGAAQTAAGYVPEIMEATRYDISPEVIAGWACD